jgi:hypothetical protein
MSVQKLAILVDRILTFYNEGIVGLAEQRHKNTTTNQNDPSPSYPPAALPYIAMATATAAPTLSAASLRKSMQGSPWRFLRCHGRFLHLERRCIPHQIIEQWALPWPCVAET